MKKMADMMSKTSKWLLVFGIVISQLSFPLQVIAEEVIDDVVVTALVENTDVEDDTIVVDYDELDGNEYLYTINSGDETNVTFTLKSEDIVEVVSFDFSEKLYGEYHYSFLGDRGLLVINYVGNNIELLEEYALVTDTTKEFKCSETECVISGFGTDLVTVSDITNKYYDVHSFEEERNGYVSVTDGERLLEDDEVVLNGYELVITNGLEENLLVASPASIYTINRVGDVHVPSDGIIDSLDQESVLEDVILGNDITSANDVNKDGVLNILDATDSIFMNIYNGEEISDVLVNSLVLENEEILLGESVLAMLYVSGLEDALIYGFEGLLNYDETILELVGVSLYTDSADSENLGYFNLANNKFAYVLPNGFNNIDEALITFEFEALSLGETEISVNNIVHSYGEAFSLENDSTLVNLSVEDPEDNKGGDVEEEGTTTPGAGDNNNDSTTDEVDKETMENEVVVKPVVTPVVKSSDYYIKDLVINGYEIDFDMYTYDYNIKVSSDVTSLDLDVLLNDSSSIYYVEGNENFVEGENLVYVVVKAENGSTKTYTIKVEKESEKVVGTDSKDVLDEEEEEESNISKTIIIILIILVIIGLIYVIFKDDEEDNTPDIKKEDKPVIKPVAKTEVKKSENTKKVSSTTKTTKGNSNTSAKNSNKKNTKKGNKK